MKKILVKTIEEFQEFCHGLGPIRALDFETSSLDYVEMEFHGFSLCDGDKVCYTANPKILPYLAGMMGQGLWLFHNASFDLRCCTKFCDTQPDDIFCTLVGAKLVNENLQSYSLKFLAETVLKVDPDIIKKYNEVADNITSPEFIDYAMNDAVWTHALYYRIIPRIKKEDLDYIAHIEMDFQRVLAEMEMNGVLIDTTKLLGFRDECSRILFTIESGLLDLFGLEHDVSEDLFGEVSLDSPINFGSSKQLIDVITGLGFVIDEKTEKGNPSVGSTYLNKMRGKHEFFDLLIRFRKLQKLMNGFLTPLDGFCSADGRIRPSYNMVRTGRLSCSKPNLQQLPNPKKEKLEFNHRELFIPNHGNVFVKADYSGQELRVLGEVSNDSTMRRAFSNNYDLHLYTANRVFKLDLADSAFIDGGEEHTEAVTKYKAKRHQAKNGVNFPIVYGATAGRIAKDNKVSKAEAERWLEQFFELYPGVKIAIDAIPKELARYGFVRTLFGRKRRFPDYCLAKHQDAKGMERQAFNMKIQGSSADIGKIAGIHLMKALPDGAKIILFVHDEWVVECPKEMAEEVASIMKSCMEDAVSLSVNMIVEYDIVNNFGE